MKTFRNGLLALLALLTVAHQAQAEPVQIQGPNLSSMDKATLAARAKAIRGARGQAFSPVVRQSMVQRLVGMDLGSAEFKSQISSLPLQARAAIFTQKAAEAGTPAASHDRRLRGMLAQNGKKTVAHHKKQLVEVTTDNFDLFRKTMGGNTVWFAVNATPGHLHTLLADQGGGDRFHHNTYGVTTDTAGTTAHYTQYAMGVQLTDGEMDRLTRYMNTATTASNGQSHDAGKNTVFGFYNSRKQKVTDIRCTNWATAAPIGELPRWARTLEGRVGKLVAAGTLASVPEVGAAGGIHAALAAAPTAEARAELVKRVLAVQGMSKWNKSAVRRMAKAFKKELSDFPNRPADLVLRQSFAQTLGLGRSQDPAKWSYDLLMSKRVPVVAVLNGTRDANLPQKTLAWEIMGDIAPNGEVVPNSHCDVMNLGVKNLGVVPPERRPRPVTPVQPTTAQ
jgi:hypothetical protein